MANRISFILLLTWRHLRRFSQEPLWCHSGCLFTNKWLRHIILWNSPLFPPDCGKAHPKWAMPWSALETFHSTVIQGGYSGSLAGLPHLPIIYLIFNQCWKYLWPFPKRCALRVAQKSAPPLSPATMILKSLLCFFHLFSTASLVIESVILTHVTSGFWMFAVK